MGAGGSFEIVDKFVHLLVGCSPVKIAILVLNVTVKG
jgi:hypothetical protein